MEEKSGLDSMDLVSKNNAFLLKVSYAQNWGILSKNTSSWHGIFENEIVKLNLIKPLSYF